MLLLNDIDLQFGHKIIFQNLNIHIKKGSKYSLLGRNGAGKTTFFRLLTQEQEYDKGSIKFMGKNINIAYLPQEILELSDKTILEEILSGSKELIEIENELKKLEEIIHEDEKALERYTLLSERFELLDGFNRESKAKQLLSGIGFKQEDFNQPISKFSGGWRMRVYLTKLLLNNPDLLLLDEPTNHLDLPAMIWLEHYLKSFNGTLIIISHDKIFLEKVTEHIIEIDQNRIFLYKGDYDSYLKQKEENRLLLIKHYNKQQEEMESLRRFITKFKAKATKAAQARSKMKQLEKIEANAIILPHSSKKMRFNLPIPQKSGKEVVNIKNMSKHYSTLSIFDNSELTILRDERVSIVGANGIGKTTLLKIVANLTDFDGDVKLGHNVNFSYFGQHQIEELNLNNDIITEMQNSATYDDIPRIRTILGSFMFTGDDVFQKISTLSGGEKSRLALAKMLLFKANLLLLDEPTNHLDIDSKDILLEALKNYEGTILFVSHDRYFIKNLATNIVSIEDKKLVKYQGGYQYYIEKLENANNITNNEKRVEQPKGNKKDKNQKRYEAELRNKKSKILAPLKKEFNKIESLIEDLETKKEEYLKEISNPEFYTKNNGTYIDKINKEMKTLDDTLEKQHEKWEELYLEIEEIEESFQI